MCYNWDKVGQVFPTYKGCRPIVRMSKIFPMRKEYHNVQLTENGSKEIFHVCKGHRVEGCFDASNMVIFHMHKKRHSISVQGCHPNRTHSPIPAIRRDGAFFS